MQESNTTQKVQKSLYWKVTIILSNLIAVVLLGAIIWSFLSDFIFSESILIHGLDWLVRIALTILGIWYGVRYIAKKSFLQKQESTKVAFVTILLPVILSLASIIYLVIMGSIEAGIIDFVVRVVFELAWITMLFVSTNYFVRKFANS